MIRISNAGFFGGNGTVPLGGAAPRVLPSHRMAQAAPVSPRVLEARAMLDTALKNLTSAEDNLSILDITLGPEAALQALEEGRVSVERAQQEYDRVLAEESA